MTEKILKVFLEIDLAGYEDWCQIELTDEQIQKIKEFLEGDNITYNLRDFINSQFSGLG